MMKKSRRSFLKVAGIAAVGLGAAPAMNFASSGGASHPVKSKNHEALTAHRWGMVIDTNKVTEEVVEHVMEACHKNHNVPDFNHEVDEEKFPNTRSVNHKQELKWIWEEHFKYAFPDKEDEEDYIAEKYRDLPFLVTCNHCKNAPCVKACPTQATFKREDGIVLMDYHRCIGCRFCMAACPFGARNFNFRDPRPFIEETASAFPTRSKGVVEKCNLCAERLAKGEQPHCVEASEGAITVGDLEDPESEVRALMNEHYTIRRKQSLGTEPSVYYVM